MKEDKHLYSYKQALSQPYWIQKFNDQFSLKSPLKFSRIVYFVIIFGILWLILASLFSSLAFGLRGMVSAGVSLYLSMLLSDLVVDGKSIVIYLKDYLAFYLKYGLVADRIVINKGQVYEKPVFITKTRKERYDSLADSGS